MPSKKVATPRPTPELSAKSKEILAVLETAETPLTLAEIKENFVADANPSNLSALISRGLVTAELVERKIMVEQKRTVNTYRIVKRGE
jgi:chromosome segregation and condensation protein ScpB